MKALLVDPGVTSSIFIERLLEKYGLVPFLVRTAQKAYQLVQENSFDIVITTLILPDGDGISLSRTLRPLLKEKVPIVLITSSEESKLMEHAFNEGITVVVKKNEIFQLDNFLKYYLSHQDDNVSGAQILLVEDSNLQQKVLKEILERRGYIVDCANNLNEALTKIKDKEYELFIIDLILDEISSGINLIQQLRTDSEDFILKPIIVLTAYDDLVRKSTLYRLGINDYVIKPPHDIEFLARVYNIITMRRLYQQLQIKEKLLNTMALTDALTGIPNRRAYEDVSKRYFELAKREKFPLTILIVDIDHFKKINDQFGHPKGDEVLRVVAREIYSSIRASDFVARYGGEEFVVLLMNCSLIDARVVAEKIKERISQNVITPIGPVTVSIGVSQANTQDETIEQAFERADKALYQAKQQGRNRVCVE